MPGDERKKRPAKKPSRRHSSNSKQTRPQERAVAKWKCQKCGKPLKSSTASGLICENCQSKETAGDKSEDSTLETNQPQFSFQEAHETTCPTCGTSYSYPAGEFQACPHCQREEQATDSDESHDSSQSIPGEFIPLNTKGLCPNCGASITIAAGETIQCETCGTKVKEEVLRDKTRPSSLMSKVLMFAGSLIAVTIVLVIGGQYFSGPETGGDRGEISIPVVDDGNSSEADNGAAGRSSGIDPKTITESTDDAQAENHPPLQDDRWRVTIAAGDQLTIDGVQLLKGNESTADWTLVIPCGSHLIRRGTFPAELITVHSGFEDHYQTFRASCMQSGAYSFDMLLKQSRSSLGILKDPLLLHVWGNYYWQEGHPEAAIRFWNECIRIEPSFAPSHLNLAYAFHERGDQEAAQRELRLAFHFNHLDAYGLSSHIADLGIREGLFDRFISVDAWDLNPYRFTLPESELSQEQQQVLYTLLTIQQYVTDETQRLRITNNIGAYLLSESNASKAYGYLREILQKIVDDPPLQRDRELLRTVLSNIAAALEQLQMAESSFYAGLASGIQ